MKSKKESVNRRGFLKGAAASAAALVATPVAKAARVEEAPPRQRPSAVVPNEAQLAADSGAPRRVEVERIVEHPGSDFMMDVLKTLNFEYITTNPGSSFQGLHESIINYGGNKAPELLTCCHEESAVAMAHGYAKIEGKPIMALLHGTVGTQHGSMAIYNAYADRVPIYIVIGNHMDAAVRPAGVAGSTARRKRKPSASCASARPGHRGRARPPTDPRHQRWPGGREAGGAT